MGLAPQRLVRPCSACRHGPSAPKPLCSTAARPSSRRLSVDNPDAFLGGMIDWSGSCVVHATGGFIALVGAAMVGPRRGRFDTAGKAVPMPGSNASLQVNRP